MIDQNDRSIDQQTTQTNLSPPSDQSDGKGSFFGGEPTSDQTGGGGLEEGIREAGQNASEDGEQKMEGSDKGEGGIADHLRVAIRGQFGNT